MTQHFREKIWTWFAKKTGLVNNTAWNRYHWKKYLEKEKSGSLKGAVGYDWGNPESADDRLGNYKKISFFLQEHINHHTRVVEIGSYGGKWTQYMSKAGHVTCVDLFEESFDFLKERIGTGMNLQFYKTRGDELEGIAAQSTDLVFSMDTFVRVPAGSIRKYFFEIFRVLKKGGEVLIHLPCREIPFCRRKAFTSISTDWIKRAAQEAGFEQFRLDFDILKHGILFFGSK